MLRVVVFKRTFIKVWGLRTFVKVGGMITFIKVGRTKELV